MIKFILTKRSMRLAYSDTQPLMFLNNKSDNSMKMSFYLNCITGLDNEYKIEFIFKYDFIKIENQRKYEIS